jgi:hypothetical protein
MKWNIFCLVILSLLRDLQRNQRSFHLGVQERRETEGWRVLRMRLKE